MGAYVSHRAEPFPPLAGSASVCQGVYGEVGNLELVAPDPEDGIWVFWNNTSRVDVPAGPQSGQWSGGLRFMQGNRFEAVVVLQSVRGPAFLELVARSGPVVHRIVWSPEGFAGHGPIASNACGDPSLLELPEGQLHALVPTDAEIMHLVAKPSSYPLLTWKRLPGVSVPAAASVAVSYGAGGGGVWAVARSGLSGTISRWNGSWGRPLELPGRWASMSAALPAAEGFVVLAADPRGRARRLSLDADGAVLADTAIVELEGLRIDTITTCSTTLPGQRIVALARCGTTLHCFPAPDGLVGAGGRSRALESRTASVAGGTVHRW